jgi:UDP-2,4-diacetamido-2,4,6-trideoxy-beta-L-altropyranose hydrolase
VRVVLRVDASNHMGTGHLVRCLTLADKLKSTGCMCCFICRYAPENLEAQVRKHGHELFRLRATDEPSTLSSNGPPYASWLGGTWEADARDTAEAIVGHGGADLLVVDHYAIDHRWEGYLRLFSSRIMAIDDLADRRHECDIVLDQNFFLNMERRYKDLVSRNCRLLLGPQFALLRPDFLEQRDKCHRVRSKVKRILVFFGGTDPTNETTKAIEALCGLQLPFAVDVVVGKNHLHKRSIEMACAADHRFRYHCQISNMAQLMAMADLSLGAGGGATLERMCVGLPSVVVVTADNQSATVHDLAAAGYVLNAGRADEVTIEVLQKCVADLFADATRMMDLSQKAFHLVPGQNDLVETLLEQFTK